MAKTLIEKHLETLTLADLGALRKMTKRKYGEHMFPCYYELQEHIDNEIETRLNAFLVIKDTK